MDKNGFALYIEVKHFYNPVSYSEMKIVDRELQRAMNKTKDQIDAIINGWHILQRQYDIKSEYLNCKALILSHNYLGRDVEINEEVPLVDTSTFYESLIKAETVEELYIKNLEFDTLYSNVEFINKELCFQYAGYSFMIDFEVLESKFEIEFIKLYRREVLKNIDFSNKNTFKTLEEHGEELWKRLSSNS